MCDELIDSLELPLFFDLSFVQGPPAMVGSDSAPAQPERVLACVTALPLPTVSFTRLGERLETELNATFHFGARFAGAPLTQHARFFP